MPLNDNDLLLINDSQDGNEAKKIKYSTLKSNINGDDGNDLQAVTDNGNTTTNGAEFGGDIEVGSQSTSSGFKATTTGGIYSRTSVLPSASVSGFYAEGGNGLFISSSSGTPSSASLWQGFSTDLSARTSRIAADGGAEFAGAVTSPALQAVRGNDGANALLVTGAGGDTNLTITGDGTVRLGGNVPTNPNISLNADGSAEFASHITSLRPDKVAGIQFGYLPSVFTGEPVDNFKCGLYNESGGGGQINFGFANQSGTTHSLNIYDVTNDVNVTRLFGDGSADFAGEVRSGGNPFNGTATGSKLTNTGTIVASAASNANLFAGFTTGTNTATCTIGADGSAEFSGRVDATDSMYVGSKSTDVFAVADGAGRVEFSAETWGSGGSAALSIAPANGLSKVFGLSDEGLRIGGTLPASPKISLSASGNGEFNGYVKIDRNIAASETALLIQTENNSGRVFEVATSGTTRIGGTMPGSPNITLNADGSAHFAGNVTSDGTIGFNLEPDNEANYNAEGEYTGPTLDVKERVMNLISRLDAIEANEVIDDATDSSLLQLVASASSRLDSLEARIAVLEGGN